MKNRIANIVFVVIFCLIICIPNLHLSREEISEQENRTLAKYVPLFTNRKINWNYGADFEQFYNDRFFCRRKLIGLNSSFKEKFFPITRNENAIKGKKGWLFLNWGTDYNFLNYYLFNNEELERGLKYLKDIKSWCDENGKVFVFLICPDKNKIYGEYYPDGYKKIRPDTESRAFQFINYVRANSDISVVYPYNELIAEKASGRLLYYKNDTHWNYDGAYIGYKALMNEIQKSLDVEQVVNDGFEETKNPKGDLNNLFPEMKFIPDETTIYYSPKINSTFENITEENKENNFLHTICNYKKYKTVFFRDSFTSALSKFISNTFVEATYYWQHNITPEDLTYIKGNADVVVLECVERDLPSTVLKIFPKTEAAE